MDINYTAEERAFRDEVRTFLNEKLPKDISSKVKEHKRLGKEDTIRWQKILNEQGWLALHWPKEYGGTGWSPIQKHIFEEECAEAGAPTVLPFGVNMVAPVIIKFGTQEQKDYYLPRILRSDDWWCQGYSEPGAGSDLASLKTRAVRDGDHYIVNGQKTWTTLGQHANMIFCLVRTNTEVKAQEGISFLLIDMNTPGITVRPIITLDGEHEVNEVFFEDVKVPVENLVGEEDKGWTYAKYLLTYERTGLAGIGLSKAALQHLKELASRCLKNGRPLIEDSSFSQRIAKVEIDLMAAAISNLRIIASVEGGGVPGAESSMLKVRGTEIRQAINDLARRAIGPYAIPFVEEELDLDYEGDFLSDENAAPLAAQYFNNRKLSIFGGSNEI
ncbi:MAG: acyl-CoA dehydrogenase family protein, partial [Alcanivorax sp.]|nr:acyl-CoA dehydrogenase family protein [Alcanivorax sp.]